MIRLFIGNAFFILMATDSVFGALMLNINHDPQTDSNANGGSFTISATSTSGAVDLMGMGIDIGLDNFVNFAGSVTIDNVTGPASWTFFPDLQTISDPGQFIPGGTDLSGANALTVPASPTAVQLIKVDFTVNGGSFDPGESFNVTIRNSLFTEFVPIAGAAMTSMNFPSLTINAIPEISSFACVGGGMLMLAGAMWLRKKPNICS